LGAGVPLLLSSQKRRATSSVEGATPHSLFKIGKPIPEDYLEQLVAVHRKCFPADARYDGDRRDLFELWNNPPIMQYWAAGEPSSGKVIGYIRWVEHGGIRPKAVIELEQIAIDPDYQGEGIATSLVDYSIGELSEQLRRDQRTIKLVYVMTGDKNRVQRLYRKTLGAKVSSRIPSFYEDSELNVDEVIMIARIGQINAARKKRGLKELASSLP